MNIRADIRLGVAGACAGLLLMYLLFAPALYPPPILRIGDRLCIGGLSGLAVLSIFPLFQRGSRSERGFALGILVFIVLAAVVVLWTELSYFYF